MRLLRRLPRGPSLAELEVLLPDLATGLRAATATLLPIALSIGRPQPALSWMALGGWLGTLADPGGSRPVRARGVLAFTFLGSLVVALGEVGDPSLARAIALVGAVAFGGSMLRTLGASASSLGTLLTIVAAVATGRASSNPLEDVEGFAAGCLLAVLLSSIVWRVWTHLPVRRAVAEVFRALASYARAIAECAASGVPPDGDGWARAGSDNSRRIRDAIENARAVSIAVRARHAGESRIGGNLRVLLGMAESQFLSLIALASEVEQGSAEARSAAQPHLGALAATYTEIASTLVVPIVASRMPPPAAPTPAAGASDLASDLVGESRTALVVVHALDRPAPLIDLAEASLRRHTSVGLAVEWRTLRDALTTGSPVLHHAIRVACAAAASVAVGHVLSPRFAAWVTVTAVVVLQPDAGATVRRAAERVVGTVLGGLVAAAIARLSLRPLAVAAIMFPLSVAAIVTRPRSYRWFTFLLTPVFLLLAMHAPGDWWVALERGVDTLAGGGLALAASILLWPRWEERVALPEALVAMERDARAYAAVVLQSLGHRDAAALREIAEARLRAAAAVGRSEASLERVLERPLGVESAAREAQAITYGRRLTLAATALDALAARRAEGHEAALEPAAERVRRFEALLEGSLGRPAPLHHRARTYAAPP